MYLEFIDQNKNKEKEKEKNWKIMTMPPPAQKKQVQKKIERMLDLHG